MENMNDIKEMVKQGIKELVDTPVLDRKLTKKELLNRYHNIHLNQFLADEINFRLFSEMKPDEVVGQMARQIARDLPPVVKDVFAKDEAEKFRKLRNENLTILKIIEKMEDEPYDKIYE